MVLGFGCLRARGHGAALRLCNAHLGIGGHDCGEVKWVALDGGGIHERPGADSRDDRRAGSSDEAVQAESTSTHETISFNLCGWRLRSTLETLSHESFRARV